MGKSWMSSINMITLWLVAIASLNWLLVTAMDFNLVMSIADAINYPALADIVYYLVGIAGIYLGFLVLSGKVTIKK